MSKIINLKVIIMMNLKLKNGEWRILPAIMWIKERAQSLNPLYWSWPTTKGAFLRKKRRAAFYLLIVVLIFNFTLSFVNKLENPLYLNILLGVVIVLGGLGFLMVGHKDITDKMFRTGRFLFICSMALCPSLLFNINSMYAVFFGILIAVAFVGLLSIQLVPECKESEKIIREDC